MCGIVYVKRASGVPAAKSVIKRFSAQRHRGTRGFGYVAVQDGKVVSVQRATEEKEILELLKKEDANEILFHHRAPTSTENYKEAAHPITIDDSQFEYRYEVIHNGHISNAHFLKGQHEDLGFCYSTEHVITEMSATEVKFGDKVVDAHSGKKTTTTKFNDSEALAYELVLHIEGFKDDIGTYGGAAFIVMQIDKKTDDLVNIYYGSNHARPLVLEFNKGKKKKKQQESDIVCLKSEGKGKQIDKDTLYKCDVLNDRRVTTSPLEMGGGFRKSEPDTKPESNTRVESIYDQFGDDNMARMGYNPLRTREAEAARNQSRLLPSPREKREMEERNRNGYAGGFKLPSSHNVDDEEDHDEYFINLEENIAEQVEEQEKLGLKRKAESLVEDLLALYQNYQTTTDAAFASDPVNNDLLDEADAYKAEIQMKESDYQEIHDRLIAVGESVPSLFQVIDRLRQ